MAHFAIFIPGTSGTDSAAIERVGLGELLRPDDDSPGAMDIQTGPGGSPGVIWTWEGDSGDRFRPGFFPDQVWIPAPANAEKNLPEGRFYLGKEPEKPPTPRNLARNKQLAGRGVTMADGYTWLLPTMSKLPHQFALTKNGEIDRVVKEQYRKFHEFGASVVSGMLSQFDVYDELREKKPELENSYFEITIKDGVEMLTAALALNYRVTFEIALMLGLLDERCTSLALVTFCELAEIKLVSEEKKNRCLGVLSIPVGWNT